MLLATVSERKAHPLKRARTSALVARQPCLICGRSPSHAHHARSLTPSVLAQATDEFTVPLCAIHHTGIHATSDERKWWLEQKIDPRKTAAELWTQAKVGLVQLRKSRSL